MEYNFEYNPAITYTEKLNIPDIGNVYISKTDLLQNNYYLLIKTALGFTHIVLYGPYNKSNSLPQMINYSFYSFEYNENKLVKLIQKFILPDSVLIEKIEIIDDINVIKNNFIPPINYLEI